MIERKNFELNEKVIIVGLPEDCELNNATGKILNKSNEYLVSFYIVGLDKPLPNALAISMIETCLERID